MLTRYRLLERLGAGGFGVVWRAYDEELQREVAIKRVQRAHPGDRAQREALATARLAHPAIAALYEARAQGESLYLISELVPGEALSTLIARGVLDDISVLETGVALTEALEHAHARGVVHRDVKPANVIVLPASDAAREHAPAKLTDFGSASIAGDDALTRTGDVLGTLAYMAPEQSEGFAATPASDLYSLALVLYEALSGFNPRRGPTPAATARRLDASLPPLARERGDLPTGVAHAVDRALAPEPELRGTLADLRDALGEALGQSPPRARRGLLSPRLPTRARDAAVAATVRQPAHPRQPAHGAVHRAAHPQDPYPLPAHPPLAHALAEPPPQALPAPSSRLAVSRLFWWAGALAAILWQALGGNPGLALVLCAFLAPLLALPRRAGPGWLAAALAPLLGAVGLAGAFPAIAGQARTLRGAGGARGARLLVAAAGADPRGQAPLALAARAAADRGRALAGLARRGLDARGAAAAERGHARGRGAVGGRRRDPALGRAGPQRSARHRRRDRLGGRAAQRRAAAGRRHRRPFRGGLAARGAAGRDPLRRARGVRASPARPGYPTFPGRGGCNVAWRQCGIDSIQAGPDAGAYVESSRHARRETELI